jgi:hypothetical protein
MTISEARNILQNNLPAHPNTDVRYAGAVVNYALRQNLDQPWHPCKYEDWELIHDGTWVDGRWYEWLDKYNNREVARMKSDMQDHFFPQTKVIKEEDVIAFRETLYNYHKRKAEKEGREFPNGYIDTDL